jgi:hypothetical protein
MLPVGKRVRSAREAAGERWAGHKADEKEQKKKGWKTRRAHGRDQPVVVADSSPLSFHIPQLLDPGDYPARLRWPLASVCDLVHRKVMNNVVNTAGYAQLKARYLARFCPGGWPVYRQVMDHLTGSVAGFPRVLETDGDFSIGRKCTGYRLAPDYRLARRLVCDDPAYCRHVRRVYASLDRELPPVLVQLRRLLAERLRIDLERALRIIATLEPGKPTPATTGQYRHNLTLQCRQIAAGDHYLDMDEFSGRTYSLLTNLPKELRGTLYVPGKGGEKMPLVWLDLANCQPLLLALVALRYHTGSRMARSRLLGWRFNPRDPYRGCDQWLRCLAPVPSQAKPAGRGREGREGRGETVYGLRVPLTPLNGNELRKPDAVTPGEGREGRGGTVYGLRDRLTPLDCNELRKPDAVTHPGVPPDLLAYLRVCQEEDVYRALLTPAELSGSGEGVEAARGKMKHRVLVTLFRDPGSPHADTLLPRWRERWPSVTQVFQELKKHDHKRAAAFLQNLEATVFIHRIGRRVVEERPDLFLGIVHDCLVTTPEGGQAGGGLRTPADPIILEEFARVGISPRLKRETYA